MTTKLKIMPAATIQTKATAIAKTAKKTATNIHVLAMECLKHIAVHGDSTPAVNVCLTLKDNGLHIRALVQWFEKYGKVQAKVTGDKTVMVSKVKGEKRSYDLEEANNNPFYLNQDAVGRTKEDKTFDLHKYLTQVVRKLETEAEKNPSVASVADAKLIKALKDKTISAMAIRTPGDGQESGAVVLVSA